jgi:signal transduction histidine kinase
VALIFTPLKNKIQNFVDRAFFKATPMEIAHQNEKLKAVATLARGLAHEIRNPLTTLKVYSEYVAQKKDDPEFIRQYEKIVPAEIDRINNLISDLLAFAKPSTPQMQAVNPSEIIKNLLILLEQKFKSSRITINTELENNVHLQADPNQLKQVLLNLILNAIDAMPNGGKLTIQTTKDNNYYTISISDTGCGIDPKDLPHIFDPFFTKKEKGTGLGLSITQGIIERHHGKIMTKSKPGQGTEFIIQLPHLKTL